MLSFKVVVIPYTAELIAEAMYLSISALIEAISIAMEDVVNDLMLF
jgi:hypothetical protein